MFKNPVMLKKLPLYFFGVAALAIASCGDSDTTGDPITTVDPNVLDTGANMVANINGKIFSIPSPFQTADLIKKSGAPYNGDLLNPSGNAVNYSTKFSKALNLGVFGADLGYATMYDNNNEALSYLTSVEQLSKELDMGGAFSESIMNRFSENMGNQDSMLVIVSDAYQAGDEYLKNNERDQEAGLILTGGWIEALYFATSTLEQKKDQNIINRIGEQKTTLDNLIEMLEQYNNEESYANLIQELQDLYYEFDNVSYSYTYVKPETDEANQLTTIKCKSEVKISDENLKAIAEKIKDIRTKIIESAL